MSFYYLDGLTPTKADIIHYFATHHKFTADERYQLLVKSSEKFTRAEASESDWGFTQDLILMQLEGESANNHATKAQAQHSSFAYLPSAFEKVIMEELRCSRLENLCGTKFVIDLHNDNNPSLLLYGAVIPDGSFDAMCLKPLILTTGYQCLKGKQQFAPILSFLSQISAYDPELGFTQKYIYFDPPVDFKEIDLKIAFLCEDYCDLIPSWGCEEAINAFVHGLGCEEYMISGL